MKRFNSILIVVLIGLTIFHILMTVKVIKKDFEMYKLESECAMKLVHSGINRKDIRTFDGTCEVIHDGVR